MTWFTAEAYIMTQLTRAGPTSSFLHSCTAIEASLASKTRSVDLMISSRMIYCLTLSGWEGYNDQHEEGRSGGVREDNLGKEVEEDTSAETEGRERGCG